MDTPVDGSAAVIVVGSLNVDERVRVARLPLPGETAVGPRFERGLGGKGANQAVASARAGARTRMVGAVGHDDDGRWARETLRADGVDVESVASVDDHTGKAVIAVDDSAENVILVGLGAGAQVSDDVVDAALEAARPGDLLLLQLELPLALARHAAQQARAAGMRVVLNAAPAPSVSIDWLHHVDVLVVNVPEAAALAGEPLSGDAAEPDPADLAAAVARRAGVAVACTAGADGAVVVDDGEIHVIKAPRVHAVDTTGAGDAFVGYLAAGLAAGAPLTDAASTAVHAASIAVTRPGALASVPYAHELDLTQTT